MKLYLVTHAHTEATPEVDARGWSLSAEGEGQAALLAMQPFWGAVDRIYLSSEPKTRLTVEPVLRQRALPVTVDARLDELRRPGWVEDYRARVAQAFAAPEQPAGDWEPASVALARILAAVADLCAQHPNAASVLVGHGLTLSLYRAHLLGQTQVSVDDWRRLSFAAVAIADPIAGLWLQDFVGVAGQSGRG
ncbi:MAG: phosphoglycerate mutase family protein [Caldilineaceae bacterium]|nr:phosphoglycerate mutase family protein [Caldilineaceae bacterium]